MFIILKPQAEGCMQGLGVQISLCLPPADTPASALPIELGKVEIKVFDPDSLDPDRCESCYGAETEDIK